MHVSRIRDGVSCRGCPRSSNFSSVRKICYHSAVLSDLDRAYVPSILIGYQYVFYFFVDGTCLKEIPMLLVMMFVCPLG